MRIDEIADFRYDDRSFIDKCTHLKAAARYRRWRCRTAVFKKVSLARDGPEARHARIDGREELTMSRKGMLGAVSVKEVRGVVGDLMEKCSGKDGRKWLVAAKRFLRGEDPWPRQWKVAFQSDLGAFLDVDQIFEQVGRFDMDETAERAIRDSGTSFRMGSGNLTDRVRFVELTPRDLGFMVSVPVDRLVEKAAESGLVPCPPEIALHLPSCVSGHDFDRPLHVISRAVVVTEERGSGSDSSPYRFSVVVEAGVPCLRAGITPHIAADGRVIFALPDFATRWWVTLGECKEMELLDRLLSMCGPGRFALAQAALVALHPRNGFSVATEPTGVDLVTVSVGELGFLTQATCDQVIGRAESFGLETCSAETVPALVLERDTRSPAVTGEDNARYFVPTEPDGEVRPTVFVLTDRSLNVVSTDRHFFRPDDVFVFAKSRKQEVEGEMR